MPDEPDLDELRERFESLQKINLKHIQELIVASQGKMQIDPRLPQDLMFALLVEAVFPPDTVERYEAMITVEEQITEIVVGAKSSAAKMLLTEGMAPAQVPPDLQVKRR